MVFGSKFRIGRSNSKASYLPRQPTRDKLANDPDRGSYKLTLTSNEDSINHNVYPDDILSAKCNLPDVLPVGVKYQNQTRYPAMINNSHSHSNYNSPPTKPTAQTAPAIITSNPQSKSIFHFPIGSSNYPTSNNNSPHQQHPSFSTPTKNSQPVFHANQAQPQYPPTYNTSSPTPGQFKGKPGSTDAISPKYMSQSTFDLKKTQIIEHQMFNNEDIFKEQHAEQQVLETPFEYCEMNLMQGALQMVNNDGYDEQGNNTNNENDANDDDDDDVDDDDDDDVQLQQQQQPATINKSEMAKKLNFEKIESTTIVNNNNHLNSSSSSCSSNSNEVKQNNSPNSVSCSNNSSNTNSSKNNSPLNVEREMVMTCTTGSQTTTTSVSGTGGNKNVTNDTATLISEAAATVMTNEISIETTSNEQLTTSASNNSSCDIDSLKLMQRTELVLRLNAPTAETACQTDESVADVVQGVETLTVSVSCEQIVFSARQKTPEEVDCEKLSQDLVSQLSTTDKLYNVLAPKTFKTSADYVTDLYKVQIKSRPTKRLQSNTSTTATTTKSTLLADPTTVEPSSVAEQTSSHSNSTLEPLPSNSAYISISEPKAKVVTRYNREMTLINGDCSDLTKKKEELVARLGKKLIVLANEQATVTEESAANDVLGNEVSIKVAQKIKPSDASKFRSYVEDVGYITMLLLSLSGRLARTENALHSSSANDGGERKILEVKRNRLLEQLGEAKQLKDDIDRRGAIISKILERHLCVEEFGDYEYFINMKAKLIVDSREIADKIKLGEDQLIALKETIVHSEC